MAMNWQPVWSTFVPRFGVAVAENLALSRTEGVRYLELYWRTFFREPTVAYGRGLREVWAEAEVTIDSLHGPHGPDCDLASPDDAARAAAVKLWSDLLEPFAATGCRVVVMHPSAGRTPREGRADAAQRLTESLSILLPAAARAGVTLALENLGPGQFGCREEELLAIVEGFDTRSLGLCFDTGHAHLTQRLLALHEALAPHCVHYHISDNDQLADRHAAPPYGTIPWQPFWEQVAERAPAHPLLLEVPPTLRRGVAHLRELATAVVHSCLDADAYPRLSAPGRAEFVKDAATGRFEIIRSRGSA